MEPSDFQKINRTIVEYLVSDSADASKLRWLTTQLTRLRTQVQREKRGMAIDRREEEAIADGRKWVKSLTAKQIASLRAQGFKIE